MSFLLSIPFTLPIQLLRVRPFQDQVCISTHPSLNFLPLFFWVWVNRPIFNREERISIKDKRRKVGANSRTNPISQPFFPRSIYRRGRKFSLLSFFRKKDGGDERWRGNSFTFLKKSVLQFIITRPGRKMPFWRRHSMS